MNIHHNARLTPQGRERVVRLAAAGHRHARIAELCGVSVRTVGKWLHRYRNEGVAGLADRSSRPHRLRARTPRAVQARICDLRRARLTGWRIARATGVSPATVSRVLRRAGLSRWRDLAPPRPPRRYVFEAPGAMLHLDIKKLGRFHRPGHRVTGTKAGRSNQRGKGPGWDHLHVCVDDASRLAFTRILSDETAASAVAHLRAAVAWFAKMGVRIDRVMTDNGACHVSRHFRAACAELGLRHVRTRPYTPRTNGKAERFIQTALREWAYARTWKSSDQRAAALPRWTYRYNWRRPHSALDAKPPISRVANRNNL